MQAGRAVPGNIKQAYQWPINGEHHEVTFHYAASRAHHHVETFLKGFTGTLISDGYSAYTSYEKKHDSLTHVLCLAHTRRFLTLSVSTPLDSTQLPICSDRRCPTKVPTPDRSCLTTRNCSFLPLATY